jgi:hypothetical protein
MISVENKGLAQSLFFRFGRFGKEMAVLKFAAITRCDQEEATRAIAEAQANWEAEVPPMVMRDETPTEAFIREEKQREREYWLGEERRERAMRRTEP